MGGRTTDEDDVDPGVEGLSYEDARSRLVEIVTRLEQGSIPLEEALRLWEAGERLARHCQAWLDGARENLAAAQAETDGQRSQTRASGPSGGSRADGEEPEEDALGELT